MLTLTPSFCLYWIFFIQVYQLIPFPFAFTAMLIFKSHFHSFGIHLFILQNIDYSRQCILLVLLSGVNWNTCSSDVTNILIPCF